MNDPSVARLENPPEHYVNLSYALISTAPFIAIGETKPFGFAEGAESFEFVILAKIFKLTHIVRTIDRLDLVRGSAVSIVGVQRRASMLMLSRIHLLRFL